MEFLDQAVLPQSDHHMILIKYLLVLTYIIFIPYVSVLLGSLIYSLYFKRKAIKFDDVHAHKFSKDLIDLITFNKGSAFALGLVPLLSAAFGYAQLLHLSGVYVPEYILIAALLFLISLLLIFTYKYTFHLRDIFENTDKNEVINNPELKEELTKYSLSSSLLNDKSGKYGLIVLLFSVYLFVASVSLAINPRKWIDGADIFTALFSVSAFTRFVQLVIGSLLLTSIVLLYKYFRNDSDLKIDAGYAEKIKSFSLKTSLILILFYSFSVALNLIAKPIESLSFHVFIITAVSLLLLLYISSLIYFMNKEGHLKHRLSSLFLFIIVISLLVIKDQYSFDIATKKQFTALSANYLSFEEKIKAEFGGEELTINGADIFNGRCIACHSFDKKIVGPPYNETLPKYAGKTNELIKFILNPTKVNPEYPSMPNQGLKPDEAKAVAEYLINTYKK